jgi:hypothetical protein
MAGLDPATLISSPRNRDVDAGSSPQMMVAALGTLLMLIGRLPHGSALAMVVVVVACLALALVFRAPRLASVRRSPAPGSLRAAQSRGRKTILTTSTCAPVSGIISPRP